MPSDLEAVHRAQGKAAEICVHPENIVRQNAFYRAFNAKRLRTGHKEGRAGKHIDIGFDRYQLPESGRSLPEDVRINLLERRQVVGHSKTAIWYCSAAAIAGTSLSRRQFPARLRQVPFP